MTRASKYASCLNALDDMQQSVIYTARKGFLAEAESIIVLLESKVDEQRTEIERLTALRIKYGPICVVCGAAEPCELASDTNSPCSFDPAPKELYDKCEDQAKEIARLQAQLATANERYETQCAGTMSRMQRIQSLEKELATAKGEVVWTTEKPTKPGWYWWRPRDRSSTHTVKVLSASTKQTKLIGYWLNGILQDRHHYVDAMLGEWSSETIPEPKEPT